MEIVKKLLAGVAMLTVFVLTEEVSVANAGIFYCPPHGPYEDRMMSVNQKFEVHYPELPLQYVYDEFGRKVEVLDGNGNRFTTRCEMITYQYQMGVYCKGCNWFVNQYFYAEPTYHSYCAVG